MNQPDVGPVRRLRRGEPHVEQESIWDLPDRYGISRYTSHAHGGTRSRSHVLAPARHTRRYDAQQGPIETRGLSHHATHSEHDPDDAGSAVGVPHQEPRARTSVASGAVDQIHEGAHRPNGATNQATRLAADESYGPGQGHHSEAAGREVGKARTAVHGAIRDNPGIHFRALSREAGLTSTGQLRHHIDALLRAGKIEEIAEGRYRRYFAQAAYTPRVRDAIARFARSMSFQIGQLLLEGPLTRTQLRRTLGCADSTLGYHLDRMIRYGDLIKERRNDGCVYALPPDPEIRLALTELANQEGVSAAPAAVASVPNAHPEHRRPVIPSPWHNASTGAHDDDHARAGSEA